MDMDMSGQANIIIAAVVIGAVILAGLYVVMPKVSGESGPGIPGVTEKIVKVKMDVDVQSEGQVYIQNETVETDTFNQVMSIGPFWGNPFGDDWEGQLRVIVKKNGERVGVWTKNVYVDEDWHSYGAKKTFSTDWINMGPPDSGSYTIVAKTVNDDGTVEDSDEITRTI